MASLLGWPFLFIGYEQRANRKCGSQADCGLGDQLRIEGLLRKED
jgi:hypothetical protein